MFTELETASQGCAEVDLEALIAALDEAYNVLPEEALRSCQTYRELVTPRLIAVLQEAVTLGAQGTIREGGAPQFALFLLAEFEAKEAWPVVLDFFRLPEFVLDELLDDTLTEDGNRLLAALGSHDPDGIESILADINVGDFARWQGASALCWLVADGRMPREEAVRRLIGQMRRFVADKDYWGVTIAVNELGDLNPLEVQDEIKSAFDQGLVDESMIDWKWFERHCLQPDQPGLCPELKPRKPNAIADTVEEMRGWYCFSEKCRRDQAEYERRQAEREAQAARQRRDEDWSSGSESEPRAPITIRNEAPRIGRNDPCPCGSGKKYKKCCLRAEGEF